MIKTVNLEIKGKFNPCYVKYMLIFGVKGGGHKLQPLDYDIFCAIPLHCRAMFQTASGVH